MSVVDILIEFKKQLMTFLDELIAQFPQEGDLIIIRILLNDKLSISDIMNYMIKDILPLKQMVINKDENFFINNNILFSSLDKNKVNHFKKIWRSDELDANDRDVIWAWFTSFIRITEKYQKALLLQQSK